MSKSFISPYGISLRERGEVSLFPAVEVEFSTKEGEWLSFFLIIDSGAAISALPKSDAPVFGIEAEDGAKMNVFGIGGEAFLGWRHEILVRFGGEPLSLPVVFLNQESAPRVLGRAGIFDRFILIFEERRRRSGFIGEANKEARMIQKVMDKV